MPIEPSVFRPIKANDVYQKPFKAYKHYVITDVGIGEGYVTQSAVYFGGRIDQGADHINTTPYPTNSDDTNQYIVWHSLNHRFYKVNELNRVSAHIPEHVLNPKTKRSLFISASTLSIPYNDIGERIKPGTFEVTASIADDSVNIHLHDDGDVFDDDG